MKDTPLIDSKNIFKIYFINFILKKKRTQQEIKINFSYEILFLSHIFNMKYCFFKSAR